MVWEEKTYKEKKKDEGKGNLPKPAGMGPAGTAETSTVGTTETGVVGTIEKGAESAAGMDATNMVGAGIPTPAPGPSKVSVSREIGIQMKRKYI